MIKKALLPLLIFVVLILGALFFLKRYVGDFRSGTTNAKIGQLVPDFTLHRLEGGSLPFSQMKKKLTLVNFWATWCESCVVEMPSIHKLWKAYKDQGFDVLPISVDEEPQSVVPRVVAQLNLEFPIYFDQGQTLAGRFGIHAIPTTLILDGGGKVLYTEAGERDWFKDDVKKQIEAWLQEAQN